MLYFLFCKESDLKRGPPPRYTNKLAESSVIRIVKENKNKIEPYAQLIEEALIQHNLLVVKKENQSTSFQCSEVTDSKMLDNTEDEEPTGTTQNSFRYLSFKPIYFSK